MANFTPIAFIDTFELAASLVPRMGMFKRGGGPFGVLPVKWAKDPEADAFTFVQAAELNKWPELRNTLSRIVRLGRSILGELELGEISFTLLDPGVGVPWYSDSNAYRRAFLTLHLALRTNPDAMMISGTQMAHLLPGALTLVNHRVPCSAINLGEHARIHLTIDFRKKEKTE